MNQQNSELYAFNISSQTAAKLVLVALAPLSSSQSNKIFQKSGNLFTYSFWMEKAMIILRSTKHLEVTLSDSQEEYFQGQRFKNFFTQKHD